MKHSIEENPWLITENDLSASTTASHETVFAQANGYRCLRCASPFLTAAQPGNFLAGIYDQAGAPVTELVNAPDPLPLTVFVDYEAVEQGRKGFEGYSRTLDMQTGMVTTSVRYRAATKAEVEVHMQRFVSHADRHRWGEEWTFRAVNFSRRILIRTAIDGSILSNAHHPVDATQHFTVTELRELGDQNAFPVGILLASRTRDQDVEMVEAQTLVGTEGLQLIKVRKMAEKIEAVWSLQLREGETVVIHRLGVTCTSRDRGIDTRVGETAQCLTTVRAERALKAFVDSGHAAEFDRHRATMRRLWDRIDIGIEGDPRAQRALRFNLYQLASTAAPEDDRVSIGAKGLHGEGYRGHVFWDTETFMLPFFIFTQPETAKTLLRYRFNTLPGARKNAQAGGHQGARFPWESADDGTETTPQWGVDYAGNLVRIWTGEIEVHINADITYAILKYYQVTGDDAFMDEAGLQTLFEIARFWTSFVSFNPMKQAYEIRGVIGPDEFHEHVDNNTYTNYLVRWALRKTAEHAEQYRLRDPSLLAKIMQDSQVTDDDLVRWLEVSDKMHIPFDQKADLIEQFEGYLGLKEFPITSWDANGMPLWPAGVDVAKLNETTLLKQPDVVMLFALLGEEFSRETKIRNYEFYEARTMHKSSLSPSMYAMVGLSIGKTSHAYGYFMKAAETDLIDNQGNNSHGIHTANMGGVWQTAVFGFGGLSVNGKNQPCLDPWLPSHWTKYCYSFVWRGSPVRVEVTQDQIYITPEVDLEVIVRGKKVHCEGCRTTVGI